MSEARDGQATHQEVWELLAWYVNGSATPAQRRIVDLHLADCEACRDERDAQRRLHAFLREEPAGVPDPAPGLARLLQDIERPAARANTGAAPHPSRGTGRRMKFAVAALAALAVLETAALATFGLRADYQTLSSARHEGAVRATIRMVPEPSMSVGQLHEHLRRFDLQIVAGPSEAGVYSLAPAGRSDKPDTPDTNGTAAALAGLRATPGVLFAEPVGDAG